MAKAPNKIKSVKVTPYPPLTDEDARAIFQAAHEGRLDEARRILESKGLKWLSSTVKKSQIR